MNSTLTPPVSVESGWERPLSQAVFLKGLLPLPETPVFIPSIELGGGRAADLHSTRTTDVCGFCFST
jgi:hypothetical protein